ncbi:Hypothetical protein EIN_005170, partial [Entamoeba invadens IP1]
MMLLL